MQWYTLEPRCYISKTSVYLQGIAEKLQSSTAKLISKSKQPFDSKEHCRLYTVTSKCLCFFFNVLFHFMPWIQWDSRMKDIEISSFCFLTSNAFLCSHHCCLIYGYMPFHCNLFFCTNIYMTPFKPLKNSTKIWNKWWVHYLSVFSFVCHICHPVGHTFYWHKLRFIW